MSEKFPFESDWYTALTEEEKNTLRAKKENFQKYLYKFVETPYDNLSFPRFIIPKRWPRLIGGKESYLLSVIIAYANGQGFSYFRKGELEKIAGLSNHSIQTTLTSLVKHRMIARCSYELHNYPERIKHLVPFQYAPVYFKHILRFAPDYLQAVEKFYTAFEYPVIQRDYDTLQIKQPPIDLAKNP